MKNVQSEVILELTKKLTNLFGSKKNQGIKVNLKDDNSFVTEIDLFVSNLLKQKLNDHSLYKSYSFFSEEEFGELHFPCAILDPIDGTRELVKGRAECAVSLGLMHTPLLSDPNNYGWLYNPFSGFNIDSSISFIASDNKSTQKILGMVSRSEFDKGHFKDFANMNPKYDITPRGSIAFKLGLLASGGCDFVLSLSPKNIWDIAGGSILCAQRGIGLYQNGVEVKSLTQVKMNGILLWATPELAQELWQQIRLVHK
jgi:myo-inositol-1(or 4)-monophosphatase